MKPVGTKRQYQCIAQAARPGFLDRRRLVYHLRVVKHVASGRTVVSVDALESDARIDELARMLAGDLASGTTRRQARELLAAASSAR